MARTRKGLSLGFHHSAVRWAIGTEARSDRESGLTHLIFQQGVHLWERAPEPDIVVRVRRRVVQVEREAAIIRTIVPIAAGNRPTGSPKERHGS